MQFVINLEEFGKGIFIFRLEGEMDVSTAPALRARLEETPLKTVRFVLFDLSGLKYVDTIGVGRLAAEARRLQDMEKEVALIAPKGQVLKVLESTNLGKAVPIFGGLEEAHKNLRTGR